MGKRKLLAVLNIIGFAGTIVINALANLLPINGLTTGELSDALPNLFVPAGLTFSIWGLIYLLLAAFMVYQLIMAFTGDQNQSAFISRIGLFFIISSLLNIGWILAWHYQVIILSWLIMLGILSSLILIYLRLNVGLTDCGLKEKFFTHLPFSVYLGWITVATIANTTALLVDLNWNGFGIPPVFWTVLVVLAAIVISMLFLFLRRDIFQALVVVWALIGIVIKRSAFSTTADHAIIIATAAGTGLLVAAIVFMIIRKRVYRK